MSTVILKYTIKYFLDNNIHQKNLTVMKSTFFVSLTIWFVIQRTRISCEFEPSQVHCVH